MKQLVIRTGAMGDVLHVTPIIERLKRADPAGQIDVQTHHEQVFWGNPFIHTIGRRGGVEYDRVINLDNAFEDRFRSLHAVDAYSEVAFGDHYTPRAVHLSYGEPPKVSFDYNKCIAFHPAKSWPSRTMPREFWQAICNRVTESGLQMIALGTGQDWEGSWGANTCDSRGRLSMAQQAAVINACPVFLCSDTGLMSVAHATSTQVVALLTIAKPQFCHFERHGVMGWGFHPIMADVPCVGCGHNIPVSVTYFGCKHMGTPKENYCVGKFDPVAIADKVVELAKNQATPKTAV